MNNESTLQVIPADSDQAAILASIARQTFFETYVGTSIEPHLQGYVEEHFTETVLREELNTPGMTFLIAWQGDEPAGYVKLRRDRQPRGIPETRCLQLERIYVVKAWQARGIGQALLDKVREIARAEGDKVLWLQVWQQNEQALAFYHKAGFTICDTAEFTLGREVTQDYLMRSDIYT